MKPILLLGTNNPGKVNEIKAIFSSFRGEILSPNDLSLSINIAETGLTYSENAQIKAHAYNKATGLPVLAEDSGLEVDLLQGAPGIYSARFSPIANASDRDRRVFLLSQLKDLPKPWNAHFHCSAILITPHGQIIKKEGQCYGVIISEERGNQGFGYDPIFFIPELGATMAELDLEIKNKISHRARAMHALEPHLTKLWQTDEKA